jgi:hypothetical protein
MKAARFPHELSDAWKAQRFFRVDIPNEVIGPLHTSEALYKSTHGRDFTRGLNPVAR